MIPVPVGGLHDDHARSAGRHGVANDREAPSPDIPRKDKATRVRPFGAVENHRGRSQNVAGVHVRRPYARHDIECLRIGNAHHEIGHPRRIAHGVEWRIRVAMLAREKLRVLFLDVRGISEHDRREIARGRGGPDPVGVAPGDQQGKAPAVVDVRVREHEGIQLVHRERERPVLVACLGAMALKEPAIQRNRATIDVQEMTRSGDLASRTDEGKLHASPETPPRTVAGRRASSAGRPAT